MSGTQAIGVFDSGYGGLTVLKELVKHLPDYDFIYLGDNARAPYGTRSFETVYEYTLQCVKKLFDMDCHLVILACNTASAKALRNIQQNDLPSLAPDRRVLGVLRPTTEVIGRYTTSKHVGVLGTKGTVASESYPIEIHKFFPEITVHQQACPMWVPLVENNEHNSEGADYFIKRDLDELMHKDPEIDTVLLACTHYPLLLNKIREYLPPEMTVLPQGELVARSLVNYFSRHPEIDRECTKNGQMLFYTTDSTELFDHAATVFFEEEIKSHHIHLI